MAHVSASVTARRPTIDLYNLDLLRQMPDMAHSMKALSIVDELRAILGGA